MATERGRLLDSIKKKLNAVRHKEIKIRMDDATPHTRKGNLNKLRATRSAGGWNFVFDVQSSNSPDFLQPAARCQRAQGSEEIIERFSSC